ncbi:MAG: pilus assembly protein [Planctomyces sp.]|nr:pilus assembly protein [Planctomyces sp.]
MTRRFTSAPRSRLARRGILSMELLMTLPIFGILLFGLLEYSLLFAARGDVADACRAGARRGSLPGATQFDVESEVLASLGPRLASNCRVDAELGERTGDVVTVLVRVPMAAASPDLLWPIGFGLRERDFVCQARMVRE